MAYQRGDITLVTKESLEEMYGPPSDPPEAWEGVVADARHDAQPPPVVTLPHSCDAWVVGGVENVKTMIDDLQTVLSEMQRIEATEDSNNDSE